VTLAFKAFPLPTLRAPFELSFPVTVAFLGLFKLKSGVVFFLSLKDVLVVEARFLATSAARFPASVNACLPSVLLFSEAVFFCAAVCAAVGVGVVDFLSPLPERDAPPTPTPTVSAVPPIIFFLVPTDLLILSSSLVLAASLIFLFFLCVFSFLSRKSSFFRF
jgi:hypothetical protein